MDRSLLSLARAGVFACTLLCLPVAAGAASLTIEQKNETDTFGTWTMIKPDRTTETGKQAVRTWTDLIAGRYTLFFEEPDGTQASVRMYHGQEEVGEPLMRPQVAFTLAEEEDLRIVVHYPFIRTGTVAIHSDPPGLAFVMHGPNGRVEEGVTPMDIQPAPEGQYSVQFTTPDGCPTPPRKNDVLVKDSRISFSLILQCAAADEIRAQAKDLEEKFVTAKVGGKEFAFSDVPQDAWFAPHVFAVAKLGIVSGYKDKDGNPTGEFGPTNIVSLAELLKIAHEAAGVDEKQFRTVPENTRARAQWYSQYYVAAEENGWVVYQDPHLEPKRQATRAEVLETLLQAFDQPLDWPKGDVFKDVTKRTPYAGAIETAARLGFVDGWAEKGTTVFRPEDPINRAEIAKMLGTIIQVMRTEAEAAAEKVEKASKK